MSQIKLSANIIFVTDLARAKQWYEEVMGMKSIDYRPPEFLEMTLGKDHFYIESENPKRAPGFQKVQIGIRSSAIFAVEDIHQFIEQAKKLGTKIVVEPVQQFWGDWNAVIADPDGNEFVIDAENLK